MRVHGSDDGGRMEKKEHEGGETEREMRVHGSGDGGRKKKKEHEGGKGEETEGRGGGRES